MQLTDHFFRGGHLSERALIDAATSGGRPVHLDRCDLCAERAAELGRFLNRVQADGRDLADEAFPAERLAAQQGQIMRKLAQIDNPVRVIAFPAGQRPEVAGGGRRVAASWVAVAAAAGLAVGVVGGQLTARMAQPETSVTASDALPGEPAFDVDGAIFAHPFESIGLTSMEALDDLTPRMTQLAARSGG